MSSTNISVARLLQLRVPIAWQEAVEVARLAGMAAERQPTAITLAGCLLGVDGTVELTGVGAGAELSIMQLLSALLNGQSAPPELLTLVMLGDETPSGFSTPAQDRPKGLSLEWFVRPNPEVEVARLAARGVAAEAAYDAAASIADLRTQVTDHKAPPPAVEKKPTPRWVRQAGVAAAVTLALGGAWLAWSRWGGGIASTLATVDLAAAFVSDGGSADAARASSSSSPFSSTGTPSAATPTASAPSRSIGAGRKSAATPAAPAVEAGAFEPALSPSAPAADEVDPGVTYVTEEVVVYPIESRVYSERDFGVSPPTMVYPKLPSGPRPDSPPSSSYVEVVVDEYGQVQRVRLRATDASLNDRMIVSAVKAWQFTPAVKDGVPVKYTLRVPVTQ